MRPEKVVYWIDPVENGSPEPDPNDLAEAKEYIATCSEEAQQKIEYRVRPIRLSDVYEEE